MQPDPGGVVVTTPGVDPPTATPFPAQPCPEGEPDEFMAEVFVDGYAVTFNASIGIFSGGEPDGFDDAEVLKALVEGLRLREKGE
jgi:hypothetical protein